MKLIEPVTISDAEIEICTAQWPYAVFAVDSKSGLSIRVIPEARTVEAWNAAERVARERLSVIHRIVAHFAAHLDSPVQEVS